MGLSLGAQGISYLEGQKWDVGVSYRYLHSDRIFNGSDDQPQLRDSSVSDIHSFDLTGTYAFTKRFSLSLTLPFLHAQHTSAWEHDGVNFHTMTAAGIGDLRLLGNLWLLDPAKYLDGNIALSLGVKAPTGDHDAQDLSYQATGPVQRPVADSIQLGDGGWGVVLEIQAYQKLVKNTYGYFTGQYVINPRGVNGTLATVPDAFGIITTNSVPDQFIARAGVLYSVWPERGLSVGIGGRIEGIPVRDLIGSDEGWRTSGYSISIEPGLYYSHGKNSFSVTTPVALYRNRTQNVIERAEGAPPLGGFYDVLVIAAYTRRF
ncbi:MAG: hypothetical protein HYY23_05500 [Verrucomicrobia bacterium]|nr:hypothetical protein [Verrucomicrobiota bacterium]